MGGWVGWGSSAASLPVVKLQQIPVCVVVGVMAMGLCLGTKRQAWERRALPACCARRDDQSPSGPPTHPPSLPSCCPDGRYVLDGLKAVAAAVQAA